MNTKKVIIAKNETEARILKAKVKHFADAEVVTLADHDKIKGADVLGSWIPFNVAAIAENVFEARINQISEKVLNYMIEVEGEEDTAKSLIPYVNIYKVEKVDPSTLIG